MLEQKLISQPTSTKIMLDLHGLSVKDARKLIEAYFAKIEELNLGEIYIITGRGNHVNSDGSRGVLKKILPKLVKPYCQSIVKINEETGAYKLILKPQQALSGLKNVLNQMFVEEEAQIEYAQLLKQQAQANDVNAMLALATIHLHKGMQGFDNPDEGLALLLKAKELGSMDAEVHLGTLYHEGILVTQDHEKAFKHFRHAANMGHPVAQYYMGVCYLHGKGVKYNDEQAVHWMKKSADNGDIHAEDSLGDFYLVGKITRQNKKLGIYYKTKAAERGLADAQIDLARCYATGYGVKQNYQTAFKWYQSAAQSDKPYAAYQVGAYLISGRIGFASNPTEAFAWFLKAAELGDGDGQAELARQYLFAEEEGIAQNLTEGLAWAKKAVDKKNKYGYYVMANAYLRGIGVEQDGLKAYDLMKLSAEANHVEAQYALGLLLTGITPSDIPQNSESGLQWLKKAAAQDHPEASDALSKLKSKAVVLERPRSNRHTFFNPTPTVSAAKSHKKPLRRKQTSSEEAEKAAFKKEFSQLIRGSFHLQPNEIILLDYKFPLIDCMILEAKNEDKQKALFVLESLAEKDCIFSLRRLASFYASGFPKLTIKKDSARAMQYLQKAVKLGDSKSMVVLGNRYEEGLDVQPSLEIALTHYQNAIAHHNPIAYCKMASLHMEGLLGSPNDEQAYTYFEQALHYEKQASMLEYLDSGPLDAYKMLGDSANLFVGERKEKQEKKKPLTQNSIDSNSKKLNKILHFFKDIHEENLPTPEVALRRAAGGLRPKNAIGMGNQKNLIQYLLTQVSDMNAASPTTGATALHNAVINNQIENVSLLLSAGANDAIKDQKGKTAKDYALESSSEAMKKLFNSKLTDEINANSSVNVKIPEISTQLDEEIKPNTEEAMGEKTLSNGFQPTFFARSSEDVSTATESNADIAESTSNICNV